jgi:hypothetical protein
MRIWIFSLLLITAPLCHAQEVLPGSTSFDRTHALAFAPEITGNPGIRPKFWVVQLPSGRRLSSNVVPGDDLAYTVRFPNGIRTLFTTKPFQPALQNDQLLFSLLAYEGLHRLRTNREGDVNYTIRWSNDLQRVTVAGGAHKFSHRVSFRLKGRAYRRTNDD